MSRSDVSLVWVLFISFVSRQWRMSLLYSCPSDVQMWYCPSVPARQKTSARPHCPCSWNQVLIVQLWHRLSWSVVVWLWCCCLWTVLVYESLWLTKLGGRCRCMLDGVGLKLFINSCDGDLKLSTGLLQHSHFLVFMPWTFLWVNWQTALIYLPGHYSGG